MGKKHKNKRKHKNRKQKRAKHGKKYSSEDELSASFDEDEELSLTRGTGEKTRKFKIVLRNSETFFTPFFNIVRSGCLIRGFSDKRRYHVSEEERRVLEYEA